MYFKLLLFRQSVMLMQNLGYFDFRYECDTFTTIWIRIILGSQIRRIRIRINVADPQHCLQNSETFIYELILHMVN
jgi:hypothetical protein